MSNPEAKNAGIDLGEVYQAKVGEAIKSVCQANGFDNPDIDFGDNGECFHDWRPRLLYFTVDLGSSLPNLVLNISSNGEVSFKIQSKDIEDAFGHSHIMTSQMSDHLDYLSICHSIAQQIEEQCKMDLLITAEEATDRYMWKFPEMELLDEKGDVKDVEYVRQVVETIFGILNERKAQS
jgi:hypothetical protein